jgi:outer membrane beta-barrel protein
MFRKVVTCLVCFNPFLSVAASEPREDRVDVVTVPVQTGKATVTSFEAYDVEIGFDVGILSVEDFNTNAVVGLSGHFFVTPKIFARARFASSETEKSNSERSFNFNPEKRFTYGSVGLGYRLFSGYSAVHNFQRFTSGIFAVAGVDAIEFADEDATGYYFGAAYKCLINESLSADINFVNHVYDRDFLGVEKTTMNNEFSFGLNLRF